ncbi:hypothetical protein M9H77_03023 [Catharanthus roseus]|uniref:Uncharacterized protein n=1 Tax=Catharanthus roseus TaxID=4058 RepID=A0ACC0CA89_CATRO|nr:hypothetical protein M9H77_03023 [Catharanthus roseus]
MVSMNHQFYNGGRYTTHRGERKGGLEGREYNRPQEEVPGLEHWHEDNLFDDYGENPNVCHEYFGGYYGGQQGDKALDKIKWKPRHQASKSSSLQSKFIRFEIKLSSHQFTIRIRAIRDQTFKPSIHNQSSCNSKSSFQALELTTKVCAIRDQAFKPSNSQPKFVQFKIKLSNP